MGSLSHTVSLGLDYCLDVLLDAHKDVAHRSYQNSESLGRLPVPTSNSFLRRALRARLVHDEQ